MRAIKLKHEVITWSFIEQLNLISDKSSLPDVLSVNDLHMVTLLEELLEKVPWLLQALIEILKIRWFEDGLVRLKTLNNANSSTQVSFNDFYFVTLSQISYDFV